MNTKVIKWVVAGLVGILAPVVFCTGITSPSQATEAIDPKIALDILNNTVQIRLFAPLPVNDHVNPANQNYIMAQGLGSLVAWQGQMVIVTHNHWGEMLVDAEYVKILDAEGTLLLKMQGVEFADLLVYSDPGTLVLHAPAGLSVVPAQLGMDQDVVAGDVITMVRQDSEHPDQLEALQAQVASLKDYKGQSVYKLALLEGGLIIPGDSGGGIWLNGVLVGNTWASFINTFKLPFAAETSLAAPLPDTFFSGGDDAGEIALMEPSFDGPSDLAIAK